MNWWKFAGEPEIIKLPIKLAVKTRLDCFNSIFWACMIEGIFARWKTQKLVLLLKLNKQPGDLISSKMFERVIHNGLLLTILSNLFNDWSYKHHIKTNWWLHVLQWMLIQQAGNGRKALQNLHLVLGSGQPLETTLNHPVPEGKVRLRLMDCLFPR